MAETPTATAVTRRAKAAPEVAIDEAVVQAAEAASTRAAEILAQAEKANAALAASLANAEAMVAKITAETTAAMKTRDAALAELAQVAAERVKEAETAATEIAGKVLKDIRATADATGEKVRAGMAEAVASAEASYERLSAQVEASQAIAGRVALTVLPATGAAGAAMADGFGRARQEISDFISERLRQDMAAQAELLGCRSLGEMSAVQTRFIRNAVSQYSVEAARLAKLGNEMMSRMVSEQAR